MPEVWLEFPLSARFVAVPVDVDSVVYVVGEPSELVAVTTCVMVDLTSDALELELSVVEVDELVSAEVVEEAVSLVELGWAVVDVGLGVDEGVVVVDEEVGGGEVSFVLEVVELDEEVGGD
jgi:hypothetical protein